MTAEQAIRRIMDKRGMRFNDLAARIGIAPNTLAGRMKSKNISIDKFNEILDALGYGVVVVPIGTELAPGEYDIE